MPIPHLLPSSKYTRVSFKKHNALQSKQGLIKKATPFGSWLFKIQLQKNYTFFTHKI
jgi:hypothetical protein